MSNTTHLYRVKIEQDPIEGVACWITEEEATKDYGRIPWPLMKQGLWPGATVTCKSTEGDGHTSYI